MTTQRCWAVVAAMLACIAGSAAGHEAHMLIGATADGRLTFHPGDGVADDAMTVLAEIPSGGPLTGYSASVPGFSLIATAAPEHDCYPLDAGTNVWLEIVAIDAPLLMVETPFYVIVNDRVPPEMRIGGTAAAHVHPLWLLDTTDPTYDPARCTWRIWFVLKDKGSTGYLDSALMTLRFAAGFAPSPADLNCDGIVDVADWSLEAACLGGPTTEYAVDGPPADCALAHDAMDIIAADLDGDGDVDLVDLAAFQREYVGGA